MNDLTKKTSLFERTEHSLQIFDSLSKMRADKDELLDKEMVPVLRALDGDLLGEHFIIKNKSSIIGRDSACQITIKDPKLSRKHCKIILDVEYGRSILYVEDLYSRNGVKVNG